MRIVHLTPGTANFHCGSCLRDMDLVKALRAQGHEITLMPLYLPLVTDGEEEEALVSDIRAKETAGGKPSVFLGGINVYLQQVSRLFRFLPGFITRRLDSEKLLRAQLLMAFYTILFGAILMGFSFRLKKYKDRAA